MLCRAGLERRAHPPHFTLLHAAARPRPSSLPLVAAAAPPSPQDWNDGRIPYFTLPPKRDTEVAGSAQLVAAWGADFDADQSAALAALAPLEGGEGGAAGTAFFQVAGRVWGGPSSELGLVLVYCGWRSQHAWAWCCRARSWQRLACALSPPRADAAAPAPPPRPPSPAQQMDTLGAAQVDLDGMAAAAEAGSGSGSGSEDEDDAGAPRAVAGRGAARRGARDLPPSGLASRRACVLGCCWHQRVPEAAQAPGAMGCAGLLAAHLMKPLPCLAPAAQRA